MPSLLTASECEAAFADVVASFCEGLPSYVHEPRLRVHHPLRLTPAVHHVLTTVMRAGETSAREFLGERTALAELSAVTVFPGALAQKVHPDEAVAGKIFFTAFVNLVATREDNGALHVYPGSHHAPTAPVENGEAPRVLALPLGSVVFMDGKLRHYGGANRSHETRPVLYASFGDLDIRGPAYSIREELKGKHRLEDFLDP